MSLFLGFESKISEFGIPLSLAFMTGMVNRVSKESLESQLHEKGWDICIPFHTSWYNSLLDEEKLPLLRLPSSSAWLIGNTKHLWKYFVAWYQNNPELASNHPLDQYCENTIRCTIERFYKNQKVSIFWSHDFHPKKLISFQRVAVTAGASGKVSSRMDHDTILYLTV
jgi:hypothetical protein